MTDTGQIPGEGLPENAGMVEQPGVPAPDAYTFLEPSEHVPEDDDLLLMPTSQGAWSDPHAAPAEQTAYAPAPEQAVYQPQSYPQAPARTATQAPPQEYAYGHQVQAARPAEQVAGTHESGGRDSGSVDLNGVRFPAAAPAPAQVQAPEPVPVGAQAAAAPPRRPLHRGPASTEAPSFGSTPSGGTPSGGVVRSLADRGPTVAPQPQAQTPAPARHAGLPTTGPEYFDQAAFDLPTGDAPQTGPQVNEIPPQAQGPWAAQPPQPAVPQAAQPEQVSQQAAPVAPEAPVAAVVPEAAVAPAVPAAPPAPVAPVGAAVTVVPEPVAEPAPEPAAVPAAETPAEVPAEAAVEAAVEAPAEAEAVAEAAEAVAPPATPAPAPAPAPVAEGDTMGRFVAVEGSVPTTPHLAPTPVPEQPVAAEAAAVAEQPTTPEAVAPAPAQEPEPVAAVEPQPEPVPAPEPVAAPVAETVPTPEPAEPEPEAVVDIEPEPLPEPEPVAAAEPPQVPDAEPEAATGPETIETPETPETPEPAHAVTAPAALPVEASAEEPAPVAEAAEAADVPESAAAPVAPVAPEAAEAAEAPHAPEAPHTSEAPEATEAPEALPAPEAAETTEAAEAAEALHPAEERAAPVAVSPPAPAYDDAEREAVLRVMRERRDIRNGFRSDPIPHEVLLRVLEAAHTAPSVGHSQPWDFVVIRSAETRRSMHELAQQQRDAYAKSLPKGRAKQFKEMKIEAILDTPVNIVVTADPTRGGRHTLGRHTQPQMAPYSSALAVENLWLAARAEGLGVGWVSFFDEREMVRALGLPEHLEIVAYLCVGYVDEFPEEPELMQAGWSKRRPLSWVVHEETYGRRALPGEEPHDLLQETISNIRPLDAKALGEAWERQKRMTKPAGALGMLEIISAQLSGLSRMCPPPIPEPAAVAIFAGDHGVHAQGVTAWPQEVTAQMVANFLGGGAVCNAFAAQVGAEVCVVDVGVASELPATPGLLPRKVRAGTADFTTGPALSREEVLAAIEVGIETARDLVAAGNKGLLTGEMGIANTTASAALICVYTGIDPAEVTGRGTGINDEMHARKVDVVRRALDLHQPDPSDPIGVLAAVGGLEHAAMAGFLLGGASLRTPVILDGVSAGAAALVARAIAPEALAACIAGHRSAEPGHVAALNKLGLRPLVDLDLRLGEGTGALLALPIVQSAARAMHEVATFDSAGVTEK
ncbi:nicotinate-nucleotide--dimethylbenzimidazole phosphoribosyltransferase [Streptomyces finlayi]|uniref:Nicotinate-nucleotide--dimethylbenzimidazole phosphoribosyltransferase n=1 Tax=Streptomyces finlayi TaxID=67296 RepID=A0A7G7BSU4_9ACTN|nr:nicotinate-nucleotide--dimethylbenzimidazole phosphoribosyltransferase [Streptomyces finlayi]QNE78409.1 nicotinate-nucleotide--dimethylbenzimidazole phosphoribosyltransferase [Streptomyces finlayi]